MRDPSIRIARIRGTLESLIHFERYTRRLEVIHEIAFIAFMVFFAETSNPSPDNAARLRIRRSGLRDADPHTCQVRFYEVLECSVMHSFAVPHPSDDWANP